MEKVRVKQKFRSVHAMVNANPPEIAGYLHTWTSRNAMTLEVKYTFIPVTQRKWGV